MHQNTVPDDFPGKRKSVVTLQCFEPDSVYRSGGTGNYNIGRCHLCRDEKRCLIFIFEHDESL